MLVTSIFSFSHIVFQSLLLLGRQKSGLCGKQLMMDGLHDQKYLTFSNKTDIMKDQLQVPQPEGDASSDYSDDFDDASSNSDGEEGIVIFKTILEMCFNPLPHNIPHFDALKIQTVENIV